MYRTYPAWKDASSSLLLSRGLKRERGAGFSFRHTHSQSLPPPPPPPPFLSHYSTTVYITTASPLMNTATGPASRGIRVSRRYTVYS